MSVSTADRSTAFTMSYKAKPAVATEVSASISTPVRSAVRTVAVIVTQSAPNSSSTVTPWMATGWHSGISSGVRLAAAIPAIRATASASPLGRFSARSRAITSAVVRSTPDAHASRTVTCLAETSTIRAAPLASTWVSSTLPA